MYTTKSFDGELREFATLNDAVRYLGYVVMRFRGLMTPMLKGWNGRPYCLHDTHVVRDELGLVVSADVLKYTYQNLPAPVRKRSSRGWRGRYSCPGYDPETFRQCAVPGIGHSGWGKWYRKPRTKAERAANDQLLYDDDMIEYDIKARSVRTGYNLPSSWDDLCRNREHNWKRQRKTQWKKTKRPDESQDASFMGRW